MSQPSSPPIFRDAPRSSTHMRVTPFGQHDDTQRMRFYIWKDVLEELRYSCDCHAPKATLGTLTGLYGLAPDGPFMEVTGFQDLLAVDSADLSIQDLHTHMQHSLESLIAGRATSMDAVNPSGVGLLWHEHGSLARLHDAAMCLHLSLFNVPYQFILSLDTQADRVGLYARRPQHPFFNSPLYLIEQLSSHEEE